MVRSRKINSRDAVLVVNRVVCIIVETVGRCSGRSNTNTDSLVPHWHHGASKVYFRTFAVLLSGDFFSDQSCGTIPLRLFLLQILLAVQQSQPSCSPINPLTLAFQSAGSSMMVRGSTCAFVRGMEDRGSGTL
jgi:hypothetical protein